MPRSFLSVRKLLTTLTLVWSSTNLASASSISLASYGSTSSTPTAIANTGLLYDGEKATYNIGTGGVWASPMGGSSWVSYSSGTAPGGGVQPAVGVYDYTTNFQVTFATPTGSITLLADDTANAYLNGFLIVAAAGASSNGRCTTGTPNCTMPSTFSLPNSDFLDGTNILSFEVDQIFGNAEGIDFMATVSSAVSPEPSSLILLGTGFFGVAGLVRKRLV